jgi:hypothetical protein
MREEQIATD